MKWDNKTSGSGVNQHGLTRSAVYGDGCYRLSHVVDRQRDGSVHRAGPELPIGSGGAEQKAAAASDAATASRSAARAAAGTACPTRTEQTRITTSSAEPTTRAGSALPTGPAGTEQPPTVTTGPTSCGGPAGTSGTSIAEQPRRSAGTTGYARRRFGKTSAMLIRLTDSPTVPRLGALPPHPAWCE